jgi:small GTP-binding protein
MHSNHSQPRSKHTIAPTLELANESIPHATPTGPIPIAEPYNETDSLVHSDSLAQSNEIIPSVTIKVIFVGDANIGKTCSLAALQQSQTASLGIGTNTYPSQSTIGVEFASIRRTIESICFKYNIWDTAGQEKYRSITQSFFKNTSIAVLFFDLTNYQSFRSLSGWLQDIRKNCPTTVIIHLVGNKLDLHDKRQVHPSDIDSFIKEHNLPYSEISAHTGESIERILHEPSCILLDMLKRQKIPIEDIAGIKINEFVEIRTGKASSLCSKCTIV